jgi:RNA polymerase sigma-70 factor, ECF subfamily
MDVAPQTPSLTAPPTPEAEAELCRAMAPRIRRYGLRHLRDHHAAEDLAQQVLITTLQALRAGRLRESDKVESFILGTCRMMVLDLRRTAHRRDQLLEQFGPETLYPAPAPQFENHPDHQTLANCVQSLRERERAVVLMSFYDENTAANVARFLNASEANVRVIRHRAIRLLRACMGVTQ